VKILCSEYLSKRFGALRQLMDRGVLPYETLNELDKMNIISKLLKNPHKELLTGLVWLLRELIQCGFGMLEGLTKFWLFTIKNCPFAIEV
jgi:hypothetical protein